MGSSYAIAASDQPVTLKIEIFADPSNQNFMEQSPSQPTPTEPKDSYVKLAMRNMVRKSRQSLVHFGLTSLGLLAVLIGLAYLTR
jgi:hypothetical protein